MLVNIPYMEHMGLLEESFKWCPWSWLTAYAQVTGIQIQAVFGTFWLGQWALQGPTFFDRYRWCWRKYEKIIGKIIRITSFFGQSVKVQTCQMSLWILWLLYNNIYNIPSFIGYTLRCDWKRNPRRRCRALRRGPWTRNTNVCLAITTLGTGKIVQKSHGIFHNARWMVCFMKAIAFYKMDDLRLSQFEETSDGNKMGF